MISSVTPEPTRSCVHQALRDMARPGLEPGTPRFSVLRPNVSNWARSPAIKRLLVGASRKQKLAICELLRCSWVPRSVLVPNRRDGRDVARCERQTPCATRRRSPRRIVQCASESRVGGLAERRARGTCARLAIASGAREEQAPSGTRSRRSSIPGVSTEAPGALATGRMRAQERRDGSSAGTRGYRPDQRPALAEMRVDWVSDRDTCIAAVAVLSSERRDTIEIVPHRQRGGRAAPRPLGPRER